VGPPTGRWGFVPSGVRQRCCRGGSLLSASGELALSRALTGASASESLRELVAELPRPTVVETEARLNGAVEPFAAGVRPRVGPARPRSP
jgi:hypothetical protein